MHKNIHRNSDLGMNAIVVETAQAAPEKCPLVSSLRLPHIPKASLMRLRLSREPSRNRPAASSQMWLKSP
jgi:hypothetical protein